MAFSHQELEKKIKLAQIESKYLLLAITHSPKQIKDFVIFDSTLREYGNRLNTAMQSMNRINSSSINSKTLNEINEGYQTSQEVLGFIRSTLINALTEIINKIKNDPKRATSMNKLSFLRPQYQKVVSCLTKIQSLNNNIELFENQLHIFSEIYPYVAKQFVDLFYAPAKSANILKDNVVHNRVKSIKESHQKQMELMKDASLEELHSGKSPEVIKESLKKLSQNEEELDMATFAIRKTKPSLFKIQESTAQTSLWNTLNKEDSKNLKKLFTALENAEFEEATKFLTKLPQELTRRLSAFVEQGSPAEHNLKKAMLNEKFRKARVGNASIPSQSHSSVPKLKPREKP